MGFSEKLLNGYFKVFIYSRFYIEITFCRIFHNNNIQKLQINGSLSTQQLAISSDLSSLVPITNIGHPMSSDFLLQQQNSVQKCFSGWWATWNVDIDRDDSVDSSDYRVWVVVVSTSVGAGSHGDGPFWVGHLVEDESEGWRHFVCEGAGDDHEVGLSWGGSE